MYPNLYLGHARLLAACLLFFYQERQRRIDNTESDWFSGTRDYDRLIKRLLIVVQSNLTASRVDMDLKAK